MQGNNNKFSSQKKIIKKSKKIKKEKGTEPIKQVEWKEMQKASIQELLIAGVH